MAAMKTLLTAGLLLGGSLCNAVAHPKRHTPQRRDADGMPYGTPLYFNFTMPIDHFTASDTRTYQNEYWVNDTFYKPGGPVFFFDLGETGSTSEEAAEFISGTYTFPILLQRYNGLGIAWQHRFYGYSLPFPLDQHGVPLGGANAFKYLTQEQAMEDVVYFANNVEDMQEKLNIPGDNVLSPEKTPWILVGGSYPGRRAAIMRVRNPETIYASWASSAVVEPYLDGSAYFDAALSSLTPNCTNDFHQLVKWNDQQYDDNNATSIQFIQERWWLADALANNKTNILNATAAAELNATNIGLYFQFPLTMLDFMHEGPAAQQAFCELMETYDAAGAESKTSTDRYNYNKSGMKLKPTEDGIFNHYGSEATLDAFLAALVWVANPYFEDMVVPGQSGLSSDQATEASAELSMGDWGNVAWAWYVVSEGGYFLGWSPDYERFHATDGILSKYYTMADARLNAIADPSNVMFDDGEYDPWRPFTLGSQDWDIGAPVRTHTMDVPMCGVPLDGTDVYGYLYEGETAAHCWDLGHSMADPEASHALGMFMRAMDAWLPCFYASH